MLSMAGPDDYRVYGAMRAIEVICGNFSLTINAAALLQYKLCSLVQAKQPHGPN